MPRRPGVGRSRIPGKVRILRESVCGTELAPIPSNVRNPPITGGGVMRKVLGLALAALFALPLVATAGEITGKIKTVDRADHAFVLEDGTRLWIDEGRLADI